MAIKVLLPYDPIWKALLWAKENCPSYITNSSDPEGKIVYYFSEENDAVIFTLRWS